MHFLLVTPFSVYAAALQEHKEACPDVTINSNADVSRLEAFLGLGH